MVILHQNFICKIWITNYNGNNVYFYADANEIAKKFHTLILMNCLLHRNPQTLLIFDCYDKKSRHRNQNQTTETKVSEWAKTRKMVKRKFERREKERLQNVKTHISRHNEHNNEHLTSTNDYGSAVVLPKRRLSIKYETV